MTPDALTLLLARLEEMDRARNDERSVAREFRLEIREMLGEIRAEVKKTNGRVTAIELAEATEKGERSGRQGSWKLLLSMAGLAAAISGATASIVAILHG